MSRTYRNFKHGVDFCNNCNKPVYQHTVGQYELCDCPDKTVEMEVNDYSYKTVGHEYFEGLDMWLKRTKRVYNGKKIVKKVLPKSTYIRYNVKAVDGKAHWSTQTNAGVRKDAQKYRNTKLRQKTKQVLNDRTIPYEEMVFPIKKNEVDWDVF